MKQATPPAATPAATPAAIPAANPATTSTRRGAAKPALRPKAADASDAAAKNKPLMEDIRLLGRILCWTGC